MEANDFRGKALNVGDTIAYPGRSGSNLWMNEGEIIAIRFKIDQWGRSLPTLSVRIPSGRIVDVHCIDRVALITP